MNSPERDWMSHDVILRIDNEDLEVARHFRKNSAVSESRKSFLERFNSFSELISAMLLKRKQLNIYNSNHKLIAILVN